MEISPDGMMSDDSPPAEERIAALERELAQSRETAQQQQKILDAVQLELRHRQREMEAMRRTSEALHTKTSVDEMLRETLSLAIGVMQASAGAIFIHDEPTDRMIFRHVIGPIADELKGRSVPVAGIAGRVFRTGQPCLIVQVEDDPEQRQMEALVGYHIESAICVPLKRVDGVPFGTMQVLNGQRVFDDKDLETLVVLSTAAAAAIEQARLGEVARRAEIVTVIGDISHDIKNMLTPIQSGIWTLQLLLQSLFEMWEARPLQEDTAWCAELDGLLQSLHKDSEWILRGALEAAEEIQARTKEIADAVKGEISPPVFTLGDLNQTARDVVRALRPVAEKRDIEITLELDAMLHPMEFDRKLIYNALYNLLDNALSATPPQGCVTLRTCAPADSDGEVIIEVSDTGHGIPEPILARLFTDSEISTKPGGTGLGTRIVSTVVKRHNGTITAVSEPGKGATFTMRLPIRRNT